MTAAEKGDKEAVKALLVGGYKELEERGEYGNTALIMASKHGHLFIVQALIAAGANINAQNKVSRVYENLTMMVDGDSLGPSVWKHGTHHVGP